jgi:hypothetical protein
MGVSPFCVSLVESCDIPETGEESHNVLIGCESIWRFTVLVCVGLVYWSDEKCGTRGCRNTWWPEAKPYQKSLYSKFEKVANYFNIFI